MLWAVASASSMHSQPMLPALPTEEELKLLNEEVDKFRNSLSAQERAEFDAQVDMLAKEMEKMSEEELTKFVETVFNPETNGLPPIAPQQPKTEQPVIPIAPQEPLYKPSAVPTKSIEAARALLVDLSALLESFLRKAHLIPDLFGKLNAWVPVAFMGGKQDLTWQELKKELQQLNANLKLCLAVDPETGHYYYLTSLIEQEALYQHLVQLHNLFVQQEPFVEAPAFGVGDISKSSRKATEALLAQCTQSIYVFNSNKELEKLFSGFEPEAKKVREQEEGYRKSAFEASKKPLIQAPSRVSNPPQVPTRSSEYVSSENGGYYPSSGYSNTGYTPYMDTPFSDSGVPSFDTSKSAAGKGIPSTGSVSPEKKEAKPDEIKKSAAKETPKLDATIQKTVDKIEDNIDGAVFIIKSKKLTNDTSSPDKQESVSGAATKISQAISRLKVLKHQIKNLPTIEQKLYLDQVVILVEDEKKLFDTIISITEKDNELVKEIEDLFKELKLTHQPRPIKPVPVAAQKVPAALPNSMSLQQPVPEKTLSATKPPQTTPITDVRNITKSDSE